MTDKDTTRKRTPIPSFETFRDEFLRELSLPDFGVKGVDSVPEGSRSASAKELELTGAKEVLLQRNFVRRVYGLLRECGRLLQEQRKVRRVSAETGTFIKRLRNGQKTLASLQQQIKDLDQRLEGIVSYKHHEALYRALNELETVEGGLLRIERGRAADIHPELRKKHDRRRTENNHNAEIKYKVGFRSLNPPFDYELDSFRATAPYRWAIERLNSDLVRYLKKQNVELTAITRYRVIAEVLASGGLKYVEAESIKEYFLQKQKLAKPTPVGNATNSKTT